MWLSQETEKYASSYSRGVLLSENLAKTIIIPARKNLFIQENIFNKAPVRRIASAMNTNSAITGPNTENPI